MLKLGEFLFKYRDYTPIPFVIIMITYAKVDQQSLITGTILFIIGELIRIYGVAYIGGVSRTRSYSTGQKLIKGGPFSIVRNPLYIGNLLLSTGLVVVSNVSNYFVFIFIFFFFFQYIPIVKWEENNLTKIFGNDFEEYKLEVPRWIPRLRMTKKVQEEVKGKYYEALLSEKHSLLAAFVLYLLILWRSGYLPF